MNRLESGTPDVGAPMEANRKGETRASRLVRVFFARGLCLGGSPAQAFWLMTRRLGVLDACGGGETVMMAWWKPVSANCSFASLAIVGLLDRTLWSLLSSRRGS